MSDPEETRRRAFAVGDLPLLLAGGFGLYLGLTTIGPGMNGPTYLVVFIIIWMALMVLHQGVRWVWRDSFAVSGMAALVLAGIAVARYRWGVARGMRNWDFLVLLTMLGCATFFFRAGKPASRSSRDDGTNASWWASSCGGGSSSSCGSDSGGGGGCGGGCGGGGCGGCGGS